MKPNNQFYKSLKKFHNSSAFNISMLFPLCSSIMISPQENGASKIINCLWHMQDFTFAVIGKERLLKRFWNFIVCCLLMYYVMIGIYLILDLFLRYYFYESFIKPKSSEEISKLIGFSFVGLVCGLIFQQGYFKVMIQVLAS